MNGLGPLEDDVSALMEVVSGCNFGRIVRGFEAPGGCPFGG